MPREAVKIKSDNPTHAGYYTQWKDLMKPGDEIYKEGQTTSPGTPPAKSIKPKRKVNK